MTGKSSTSPTTPPPGHAAWLDQDWTHPDGDDAGEDDEGWSLTYVPVYVCTDPSTYGHSGHLLGRTPASAEEPAVVVDDGEAEAKREERRRVLANNKA